MKVPILVGHLVLPFFFLSSSTALFETQFNNSVVERTIFGVQRRIDLPVDFELNETDILELENHFGENCHRGWFDSCVGGAKLHYRGWLPEDKPKAIVIYAHGIQSHSGTSAWQAKKLNEKGYAVYCHEYYGHGYSEGWRWLIPETWKNNLEDYRTFVDLISSKHNDSDTPIFLMGESYGSALTIHLAREIQDNPDWAPSIDSLILAAPAIEANLPPPPVVFLLKYLLAPFFPRWVPFFMPRHIKKDSKQRKETGRPVSPIRELAYRLHLETAGRIPLCLGTASNLISSMKSLRKHSIPGFRVPYCLLHGDQDNVCRIEGAKYLWDTAETPESDREFHILGDFKHRLFIAGLEKSERAMDIVIRWIEKRLKEKQQRVERIETDAAL